MQTSVTGAETVSLIGDLFKVVWSSSEHENTKSSLKAKLVVGAIHSFASKLVVTYFTKM